MMIFHDGAPSQVGGLPNNRLRGSLDPAADPDQTLTFARLLMLPGTVLEMRIFEADYGRGGYIVKAGQYSRTFVGWYSDIHAFAVDAGRLRGVSGYVIPNPAIPDMLAISSNKLKVARKGQATHDKHIDRLRYLYLDFDAEKPVEDISATEAELRAALGRRDKALAAHPDMAASAVYGCSGNGGWILVRLPDYPNDERHRAIVADAVDYFAEHFGADVKTKNPARLMPLVGTVKCKGDPIPLRPHRLVTIDSPLPEGAAFDVR